MRICTCININCTFIPCALHAAIITTYFLNHGEMSGDNQTYGTPNNSLEQTTSTNLTNTGTMRSGIAEFENTSAQSAEVNNPYRGDIDLKGI